MKRVDFIDGYARNAFCDRELRRFVSPINYKKIVKQLSNGNIVDSSLARIYANALMRWSIAKGARYYAHLFCPFDDNVAYKKVSFLELSGNKKPILRFDQIMLNDCECDGSSFLSGGLRSAYKAYGMVNCDFLQSPFVIGNTLYIPSTFRASNGLFLDDKIPFYKSINICEDAIKRLYDAIGIECKNVQIDVGVEQEFYLVDNNNIPAIDLDINKRDRHYFSGLDTRIDKYFQDVDDMLYSLGVPSKVHHAECGVNQFETSCIFSSAKKALYDNMLCMMVLDSKAKEHDMTCIFDEKPFDNCSGSGKHLNYSISVDGVNVFEKDKTSLEFLLLMIAMIVGVDNYQSLLQACTSSYSNNKRLGGNEAPPKEISICVGDDIMYAFSKFINGDNETENCTFKERNRTSPIAFVSNKFEFRTLGASMNIAPLLCAINLLLSREIDNIICAISKSNDIYKTVASYISKQLLLHKRIVYNGDNYSFEWKELCKQNGLITYSTPLDAYKHLLDEEIVALYQDYGVLSRVELASRMQAYIDKYNLDCIK